ncbi:histidine phosphatase family protein [Thiospirochaeta perfilievii]|uniref:Histidine phosphatase family protein n=1 Tax=Thiospirochaeta perfilievii TaxID=252967 RepID=A0A5C1QCL6_9SPIO|nr:histidine phosphatase family protein [Thiospirochaeta perfilievii]
MLELILIRDLNNRYYLLRHGNSIANRDGLIVSDLDIGISEYGLTDLGKRDILLKSKKIINKPYLIYSSPFKRTIETSLIVAKSLGLINIEYITDLKERFFGDFDLKSNKNYKIVWDRDRIDPEHKNFNVESVKSVYNRTSSFVKRVELEMKDMDILIVSHGDSLQILECWFNSMDPKYHRDLKPLEEGEFRPIL